MGNYPINGTNLVKGNIRWHFVLLFIDISVLYDIASNIKGKEVCKQETFTYGYIPNLKSILYRNLRNWSDMKDQFTIFDDHRPSIHSRCFDRKKKPLVTFEKKINNIVFLK